ncbi:MAG: DUF2079 domain-containing protein [Chloroflexota bacterium]
MTQTQVGVSPRVGDVAIGRPRNWVVAAVRLVGRDRSGILVTVFGLAAALWVGGLLVGRVNGLAASEYDLGFFQQIIWNVGQHGQWVSSFHLGSFLGLHFSPVLLVPAGLERLLGSDVRVLNVFHAAAIGALVPAAFLLIRAILSPSRAAAPMAAALAIGIPVWAATQEVIRADFHPETIGVVLALLAGWAGLTRRSRIMWFLAILALASREDVAYAVAIVGLLVAARGRGEMRRHGRLLTGFAIIWGVIVFGVLMPWMRDGAASDTTRYYAWLGGGLGPLLAPFTKTDLVIHALTRPTPWFAVAGMIVALAGLPLLRPRWLLLAGPPLVAALLSAHTWQANLMLQYPLVLYVPLIVAAGLGGRRAIVLARRTRRRVPTRDDRRRRIQLPRAVASLGVPLLSCLFVLLLATPALAEGTNQGLIPPFGNIDGTFRSSASVIDQIAPFAAAVPTEALLIADEGLVAPLAGRSTIRQLTSLPTLPNNAYVLMDRSPALDGGWSPERRARELLSLGSSRRPILADDGRFVLLGPVPDGSLQ